MALSYQPSPPAASAISQGEILWGVIEHRDTAPAIETEEHFVQSIRHPLAVVVTQGCDLLRDWEARQVKSFDESKAAMTHVLLCGLYEEGGLRNGPTPLNSTLWSRVEKNQNERYHHLPSATVGSSQLRLPDLYTDFRRPVALPLASLYAGITSLRVARLAVIPPIFLHDFIHRFYAFHSRVAIPE